VGDDGQHDEAIYTDFAAKHPSSVRAIAIRQLSNSEAVLAGGRSKAAAKAGGPLSSAEIPWVYSPDGAGLDERFAELGLL
jgi:phosphatidate phosphatase APP1